MVEFTLPEQLQQRKCQVAIDTNESSFPEEKRFYKGTKVIEVVARSLIVLKCVKDTTWQNNQRMGIVTTMKRDANDNVSVFGFSNASKIAKSS